LLAAEAEDVYVGFAAPERFDERAGV